MAKPGIIDVNVKSAGRNNRKTKLGFHHKKQRFRIETTGKSFFDESNLPNEEFDLMDIHLKLDVTECKQRDVISFTVIISEMENPPATKPRVITLVMMIKNANPRNDSVSIIEDFLSLNSFGD